MRDTNKKEGDRVVIFVNDKFKIIHKLLKPIRKLSMVDRDQYM